MPILTKPYENFERPGLVVAYKIAADTKVFKGSALAVDTNGYVVPLSAAPASLKFAGIAGESVDNSGGAVGAKTVNVTKCGSFVFKAASGDTPSVAKIGLAAYASTDWECQTDSTGLAHTYSLGTVVGLETTSTGASGYRVRIDHHTV